LNFYSIVGVEMGLKGNRLKAFQVSVSIAISFQTRIDLKREGLTNGNGKNGGFG